MTMKIKEIRRIPVRVDISKMHDLEEDFKKA